MAEAWEKYLNGHPAPEPFGDPDPENPTPLKEEAKLGQLIHLPRGKSAQTMGLEMNVGCEFPVCAGHPSEVKRPQIIVTSDDGKQWILDRPASGSFATPGQYRYWLWLLDRSQAAADYMKKNGIDTTLPCRVKLRATDVMPVFDITKFGRAYKDIDEAFMRYSKTVVSASTAFMRRGRQYRQEEVFGTLCTYASIYAAGADYEGWVALNQTIWDSVVAGYVKTVPFDAIMQLNGYVAQRLLVHLTRRDIPVYQVHLHKLLPKIPMGFARPALAANHLEEHHAELCRIGFLSKMPEFTGRGQSLQVRYELA